MLPETSNLSVHAERETAAWCFYRDAETKYAKNILSLIISQLVRTKLLIYSTVHKFEVSKILCFWKRSHQGCTYLIKNTVKTVRLWNIHFNIYSNVIYFWCKVEFSASSLQSSVPHDPSEIICWFVAHEIFIIMINCWKLLCCLILLRKLIKRTAFFKMGIFCNIRNVLVVLSHFIIVMHPCVKVLFLSKKLTDPNF